MSNKHQSYDLKQMQALPLEDKIKMTIRRIEEAYENTDGNLYVSFSGGKDSTVLLHLVRCLYPNTEAVFVDTGLEYPEIREHVKSFRTVIWRKPNLNFRQVILKYGYPVISKEVSQQIYEVRHTKSETLRQLRLYGSEKSRSGMLPDRYRYLLNAPFEISSSCCRIMKKEPLYRYERSTRKLPFVATLACESRLRLQSWMKHGCNAFCLSHPQSRPLSFWTEQDVLAYLKSFYLILFSSFGSFVS